MEREEPSTAKREPLSREIFERRLPELMALNESEVVVVNVNVLAVARKVLGVRRKLVTLREQIAAAYSAFDLEQFDSLEEDAFLLYYTHALVLGASRPPRCPPQLLKDALATQETLRTDCKALIKRKLIDPSRLRNLRRGRGYMDLSCNLNILIIVLHESWPDITGRCATTVADLNQARRISEQLVQVAALRDKQPENVRRAANYRARALTLLTRAYQHARFAALYVLDSKEALDAIAPPLTSGRTRSRKPPAATLPTAATEPNPTVTVSATAPTRADTTAGTSASTAAAPGAPDAEPFLS